MERIDNINLARIQWCCDDRGMSLHDVAAAVGIATSTWDRFIEGEIGLTFNQLRELAAYFGRGALFFLEPGPVNEQHLRTPQFRTIANERPDLSPEVKTLIERVEKHRELYLSLLDDLDEEPEAFDPPAATSNAKKTAAAARQWLGLNNEQDFGEYRAAVERQGILVFRTMGYHGQWRLPDDSSVAGFSLYYTRCPVIVVRRQWPEQRQTFTLMHELGHLLLHKSSFIDDEDDLYSHEGRERVANAFAGHLLVPDERLNAINLNARPGDASEYAGWLRQYTQAWGVSAEVILRRLANSGKIAEADYQAYRDWWTRQPPPDQSGGSRQYRHREPLHIFGGRFVRTVVDALHARQISLNKASGYLDNLKIKDVHALEAYVANA